MIEKLRIIIIKNIASKNDTLLMFTYLFLGYSESYADVKYILVRQNTNRNSVTNMEEDETA